MIISLSNKHIRVSAHTHTHISRGGRQKGNRVRMQYDNGIRKECETAI